MSEKVRVASASEVAVGSGKLIKAGGKELALLNVGGTLYATQGQCPHRGGPLEESLHDGNTIICPWHGWQFDITTGQCVFVPGAKLDLYSVTVEGDDVYVTI